MMLPPHKGFIVPLVGTLFLLMAPASGAAAPEAGGVSADPGTVTHNAGTTGGAAFGAGGHRLPGRPRIRSIRAVAARVTAGRAVRLVVRVDRERATTVHLRAVIAGNGVRRLSVDLGHLPTGRTVRVGLSADLAPGRYRVRLLALGRRGEHAVQGRDVARVRIVAPPRVARPKPAPGPTPAPDPLVVAPPTVAGGVFPVQGFHTYGGEDSRFGAGRTGHTHEGQDVSAARGTPVVAPVAGTVLFTQYQAGAAGEYVVLHADDGRDMFFAHCVRHSTVVKPDQRVSPGGRLCDVGETGVASGPHLHFEIWPDGWRQIKHTRPIDPLAQLRAWDGLS